MAGATGSTTGLITTFYNLLIQASYGTIKPTTAYGAYIDNHGSASITNSYGLYVAAQSGSTNAYSAIFAGGNVGFGTATPTYNLDIASASVSGTFIGLNNTSATKQYVIGTTGSTNGQGSGKFSIYDQTVGATRLIIDSAGKVGIGTATPSAYGALTVAGDVFVGPVGSGGYGRLAFNTQIFGLQSNVYWNGTSNTSSVAGYSSLIDLRLDDGSIRFSTSTSVAVNTALVMTERMTVTSAGNVVIGSGEGTATLAGNTLRGPSAAGTNIAGGSLTIAGGAGTGTGSGGNITFQTALTGITGSSSNAFMDRMSITPSTFYVQKQKLSGIGATVSWTTVAAGAISSALSVGAAGSGYLVGDRVYVNAGNFDAIIAVSAVSGTQVTAWSLVSGGTGYTANGTGAGTLGINRSAHVFGFANTETILYPSYDKQGNTAVEIAAYGNGEDLGFPNLVFSSNALGPGSAQTSPYLGMLTWAVRNTSFADKRAALFGGELEANSTTATFGRFIWYTSSGAGIEERMRLTSGGTFSIGTSSPSTASRFVASTSTGSGATATWATVSGGGAITGTVSAPVVGSGYAVGDQVRVSGAGNGDAILRVATLTGSGVATWTLISGGTGYTAAGTGVATGVLHAASFLGGNVGIGTISPGAKLDVAGTLRLNGTTVGTNYTEIKAAAAATAATYTLPSAVPSTTGQVLSSDTSGNMSWTTAAGSNRAIAFSILFR